MVFRPAPAAGIEGAGLAVHPRIRRGVDQQQRRAGRQRAETPPGRLRVLAYPRHSRPLVPHQKLPRLSREPRYWHTRRHQRRARRKTLATATPRTGVTPNHAPPVNGHPNKAPSRPYGEPPTSVPLRRYPHWPRHRYLPRRGLRSGVARSLGPGREVQYRCGSCNNLRSFQTPAMLPLREWQRSSMQSSGTGVDRSRLKRGLLNEWALVDWDNTIRPGFAMIDWIEFLVDYDLASSTAVTNIHKLQVDWQREIVSYPDFIQSVINTYQDIEIGIDKRHLRELATLFVGREEPLFSPHSVGSVLFELFTALEVKVHIISGSPLVLLRQYARLQPSINRITGVSSKGAINLLSFKHQAAEFYRHKSALFGIGDSETDIPLFDHSRFAIGINFDSKELRAKAGLMVKTDRDLRLSSQSESALRYYIHSSHAQVK